MSDKSTHQAEVVALNFKKLEGSDNLSVMTLFGGYTVVGNTNEWAGKTKACYIVPDTLVNTTRPEFAWLADRARADGWYRVTARKFSKFGGVISYGLLCPVDENAAVGSNMWDQLGLARYEPEEMNVNGEFVHVGMGGEVASAPNVYHVGYDVDSLQRWAAECLNENDLVLVTEKIHGSSFRCVYHDGKIHVGSRNEWKKEFPTINVPAKDVLMLELNKRRKPEQTDEEIEQNANSIIARLEQKKAHPQLNSFWMAYYNTPELAKFCEANPDVIVHGEAYGYVQKGFPYDVDAKTRIKVRVFDLMKDGKWIPPLVRLAMLEEFNVPTCPILAISAPYDLNAIVKLSMGQSTLGSHIREGCVVEPLEFKYHPKVGRVKLKMINPDYLLKGK